MKSLLRTWKETGVFSSVDQRWLTVVFFYRNVVSLIKETFTCFLYPCDDVMSFDLTIVTGSIFFLASKVEESCATSKHTSFTFVRAKHIFSCGGVSLCCSPAHTSKQRLNHQTDRKDFSQRALPRSITQKHITYTPDPLFKAILMLPRMTRHGKTLLCLFLNASTFHK